MSDHDAPGPMGEELRIHARKQAREPASPQEWPTSPSDRALHFVVSTHSKYFTALNAVEKLNLIKDLANLIEKACTPAGVDEGVIVDVLAQHDETSVLFPQHIESVARAICYARFPCQYCGMALKCLAKLENLKLSDNWARALNALKE